MFKFVSKIIVFFFLIFITDRSLGYFLDYMNSHQKGNYTKDLYYGLMQSHEDILIFGSSRAMNHYVPAVLEDSLGMTAYNCGYAGEGVVFHCGRLRKILQRYKPKLIIYDIEPLYDIKEGSNERFLDRIKPNANDSCISNYIKEYSYNEYLKTFSRSYCYNALFYDILKGFFTQSDLSIKGYRPLFGSYVKGAATAGVDLTIDTYKLQAIEKLIQLCHNNEVSLLLFTSPRYGWTTSEELVVIKQICEKYKVPFYDFYSNNEMTHDENLFFTSGHLNDVGARHYTSKIVSCIKETLDKNTNGN